MVWFRAEDAVPGERRAARPPGRLAALAAGIVSMFELLILLVKLALCGGLLYAIIRFTMAVAAPAGR